MMEELSVTATEAMAVAADGVISTDSQGTILFCNSATARMFGYSEGELLGQSLNILLPERFKKGHGALLSEYARGDGEPRRMMATRREVYGRRSDGKEFPMEVSLARSHPNGNTLLTAVLRDVSERKELEKELAEKTKALQESEARMRLALQSGKLGVWEWERETDAVELDDRSRETLGLSECNEVTSEKIFARIHPEDLARVQERISAAIEGEENWEVEFRVRDAEGSDRRIAAFGMVRDRQDGRARHLVGVISDVTRRWEAEQDRELLSSELHHRLQNVITVARSIVSLSAAHSDSAKDLETSVQRRLAALSDRHKLLLEEGWRDAGLNSLISGELRPYVSPGRENLHINGPEVRISPRAATALGLAFHELATNAAKYGALRDPSGKLTVLWAVIGERAADRQLEIKWQEHVASSETKPERKGFGTRVIDSTIKRQLGGSIQRDLRQEGLTCTILLSLNRLQDAK